MPKFDVQVGSKWIRNLKISHSGDPAAAVVKTVSGVKSADGKLRIKLVPRKGGQPVLCAVEVVLET